MTPNNNDLDHDVRNALIGMSLEIRRIVASIMRLESYLQRIDRACGDFQEDRQENS